jgi:hypothetical protein
MPDLNPDAKLTLKLDSDPEKNIFGSTTLPSGHLYRRKTSSGS